MKRNEGQGRDRKYFKTSRDLFKWKNSLEQIVNYVTVDFITLAELEISQKLL